MSIPTPLVLNFLDGQTAGSGLENFENVHNYKFLLTSP
jgi:hypothetical protein